MLRSVNVRAIAQSRLAPQLQVGSNSVRRLTMARVSAPVAKRPTLASYPVILGSAAAMRHISFFGRGNPPPSASEVEVPAPNAAVAPAAPVETTAVGSTPAEVPLATPVPSSDVASVPEEPLLAPAQHLTSTAADHQFHSDPTPLLPQSPANAMTPTLEDLVTNSGLPVETVLNSPEAVHAAMQIGDLKLIGLEHSFLNLAGWVRDGLVGLHIASGLPWWATIAVFTLGIRMCLFPMIVRNMRHNMRLQAVSPQMKAITERMREAQKEGDHSAQMVATSNLQKLMKENDVSPFRPILVPLTQMPFFLSMFYGLRGMANLPVPQLKDGGFSWVTNLTAPDPFYILPITSVCLQLLVFTVGVDGTGPSQANGSRTMAHFRNVMLVMSPVIIGMVSQFPAAVLFYWTTTNAFTLFQAWLLRQQPVRRMLKIPQPPKIETPPDYVPLDPNPGFKDTWASFQEFRESMWQRAVDAQEKAAAGAAEAKRGGKQGDNSQIANRVNEPRTKAFLEASDAKESAFAEQTLTGKELRKKQRAEAVRARREARKSE